MQQVLHKLSRTYTPKAADKAEIASIYFAAYDAEAGSIKCQPHDVTPRAK